MNSGEERNRAGYAKESLAHGSAGQRWAERVVPEPAAEHSAPGPDRPSHSQDIRQVQIALHLFSSHSGNSLITTLLEDFVLLRLARIHSPFLRLHNERVEGEIYMQSGERASVRNARRFFYLGNARGNAKQQQNEGGRKNRYLSGRWCVVHRAVLLAD